VEKAKQVKGC